MFDLTLPSWSKNDYFQFREFLEGLAGSEKNKEWSKCIANTNYKMLAIPSPKLNDFAKLVFKGNYTEFIQSAEFVYGEELIICAKVIGLIKDFNEQKTHILKLVPYIDSWEVTDSFKLRITPQNMQLYFDFSKDLIDSKFVFGRRMGAVIFLKLVKFDNLTAQILKLIEENSNEKEYYVNMAYAWVVCEALIKNRNIALKFLERQNFNKFVQNKAISKARDSFRVSSLDKELLKSLRKR